MQDKKIRQAASIGRTFSVVAILTVFAKIIGLVRDIVVASAYGTGLIADAYNYAYLFTGNILILFGGLGGPFHSALVTVLSSRKDEKSAGPLVTQIMLTTFVGLSLLTCLLYIFFPVIIPQLLSSFSSVIKMSTANLHDQTFYKELLQQLTIMLPLVVIAGVVGVSYGVLNVFNKVTWPSLSPAIASLAIIIAVLFFADKSSITSGLPLAVGTLIGALGQLLVQIPGTLGCGLSWRFNWKIQPGFAEYNSVLWPAIFSTSVGQLIVYVDALFTGLLGTGAWTAIINSNRLVQLPLGVLLTAMLVPILPRFSEHVGRDDYEALKEEFHRALRFLWFLALPISAILLAIPGPIIKTLFQRGNFDTHSTYLVTTALFYLTPSIFFYVARDLITRVFYALKDSRTPFVVAVIAIVVKAALDAYMVFCTPLGVGGISLATTIITMLNLSLLFFFLRTKIGPIGVIKLFKPLAIMLFACVVCGQGVFLIYKLLNTNFVNNHLARLLSLLLPANIAHLANLVTTLFVSTAGGLALYLACCLICKLEEPFLIFRRVPGVKCLFKN